MGIERHKHIFHIRKAWRYIRVRVGFLIIVTILIPIIGAESALELGEVVHLEDSDIGLLGATIDSQNEQVLAYGKNSKIIIINPVNPEDNF